VNDNGVHTDPGALNDLTDAAAQQHTKVAPDGSSVGYKARRTLRIRVELQRQIRRRRTQLVLGFLVLLPFILALSFEIGQSDPNRRSGGFVDLATASGINFVVLTLFVSSSFLLPMIVALFFGDTIIGSRKLPLTNSVSTTKLMPLAVARSTKPPLRRFGSD